MYQAICTAVILSNLVLMIAIFVLAFVFRRQITYAVRMIYSMTRITRGDNNVDPIPPVNTSSFEEGLPPPEKSVRIESTAGSMKTKRLSFKIMSEDDT